MAQHVADSLWTGITGVQMAHAAPEPATWWVFYPGWECEISRQARVALFGFTGALHGRIKRGRLLTNIAFTR